MDTVLADSLADRRFMLLLLGVFGGAALLLATLGVYSVISFLVTQRRQEIGVRVALGAQRSDIMSMILRRSAVLVVAGLIPGVVLAYAAGRSMEALLAGVKPADTTTMAAAIGLAIVMATAGSVLPTARALRVDPITALRTE